MASAPSHPTRQLKAMALVARGWTFGKIGARLKIAPRIVLLYRVQLQRRHGARTPGALTQILLQARLLPMKWARAQTPRRRARKQPAAPPPAVPTGPPRGQPEGDGSA